MAKLGGHAIRELRERIEAGGVGGDGVNQVDSLRERVADLEARLDEREKLPHNSESDPNAVDGTHCKTVRGSPEWSVTSERTGCSDEREEPHDAPASHRPAVLLPLWLEQAYV